ncbi:MAG TPA: UDP-glucose 4-epimerase GalE [Gammaproteobacteria bacterium]
MKILVTGGTGYIGSHACVELLDAGHDVVILDNLANSKAAVAGRIARIAGRAATFVEGDLRDAARLDELFGRHAFDAVLHFAGLKAVGESVELPLHYYANNVAGSVALCAAMQRHAVRTLVFSSSCTVYGDPRQLPVNEEHPLGATTNPYGESKRMIERILADLHAAEPGWSIALLRYFNPVGAHASGLIGEDPNGIPNNLVPYISQVAAGSLERLRVFGGDYPTADGTGVRDYIHVVDLVVAHLRALEYLLDPARGQGALKAWNLGTGRGHSVLEVVQAFARATGREIPYDIVARRPGDIAATWADPTLAARELGWRAERDIDTMCADTWRWQQTAAGLDE